MSEYQIREIVEQEAVYDGETYLMPAGALMHLLNFHSIGLSVEQAKTEGFEDAKKYSVRIIIETKEMDNSGS